METLFKIAWRGLWRNKRRTLITTTSVFLAVFLALFMRSMQIGSYELMIDSAVTEAGHLQVHDSGFWESKSINDSFIYSKSLKNKIEGVENVKTVIPKLETFALGSYGEMTKGFMLQGIIPELEDLRKNISDKLVEGRFLNTNDDGIVLAEGLAKFFKIGVNDTIVLIGQGYQGISAIGIFPVVGIIKYPIPKLNNFITYMSLSKVQEVFAPYHPGLVSTIVIDLESDKNLETEAKEINSLLGSKYEVIPWTIMLAEVVQQIEGDNVGGLIMLAILYLIVTFGIFGTILMMTMERRKEFAVMVAVGMHRGKLAIVVCIETLMIGLMGVVSGILASLPLLQYLYRNPIPLKGEAAKMMLEFNIEPIMPFSLELFIFSNQGVTILILASITALYPIIYVNRFKILKAMRS
ncbi:MAG: ABC transporter permease [Bacteroidetes bacterium]|nr:ABC transporter permease [Bacteroidota bacterium]